MKKIVTIIALFAFLAAPLAAQAVNRCYTDGFSVYKLSIPATCSGLGTEKMSVVIGKSVVLGLTHVPVHGTCLSKAGKVRIGLYVNDLPGTVQSTITVEGTKPSLTLTGGFDNAPFGGEFLAITLTPIACSTVPSLTAPEPARAAEGSGILAPGVR